MQSDCLGLGLRTSLVLCLIKFVVVLVLPALICKCFELASGT